MPDRMPVLFVSTWYPSRDYPTTGIFVREHALAVQRYADVRIAASAHVPHQAQRVIFEETVEFGLPTSRLYIRGSPMVRANPLAALRRLALQTWGFWRIARHLKRAGYRPAMVHAHVYATALPALVMGRVLGAPVVLTEQSSLFSRARLGRFEGWYARTFVNRVQCVMPVSAHLAEQLRRHGIRTPMKVVPNTVDTSLFYPDARSDPRDLPWRLLIVASFVEVKGYPNLLDAVAQLRQRRDDFHLDIVGDGPLRPDIEARIAALRLGDWVTLHGQLPKPAVADWMRRADLFVLASAWESLPCVLIEAMASGVPVVATHVGGVPEVVGPEEGRLVPPGDPAALSAAIDEVLSNRAAYDPQRLADSARRRYAPEVVGAQIMAIYRDVLGQ